MRTDHWPELRPASLPVYHQTKAPPPLLHMSLPILGWKRDPSHRLRLDLPKGAPFPFPHSPPGSLPQLRRGPPSPDPDCHLSTSPKADPYEITPPSDFVDLPASPRTDRTTTIGHSTASPSTVVDFKFLTINAQKAGANNPSLVDIFGSLDQNSPDFLLLTETPPILGPFSKRSANGATEYTTTSPTPRSNLTAFRKPASPIISPTQAADVGWPTRSILLGRHRCLLSSYPLIALGQQYVRWSLLSLMAPKQPLSRATSPKRWRHIPKHVPL